MLTVPDDKEELRRLEEEYRSQFARRLRKAMTASGLNQGQVAYKTRLSQNSISNYLHANYLPASFALMRLCLALDVDANELLGIPRRDG